ncbi:MAG TPA: DciA family protein [bacterium]|nr:DciA family protein [bacterium]
MARKLIDQSIGNIMRRGTGGGGAKMQQLVLAQFLYYANEELKKCFPKISQNDLRAVSVRGKSLMISCRHAVLIQELRAKEKMILKALAEKMPQFPVTALRGQIRSNEERWE